MSPFLSGFYERAIDPLEKRAVLGTLAAGLGAAGVAHGGQNTAMRFLLNRKGFARGLGHEFRQGVAGQAPSRVGSFLQNMAAGATVPELSLLRDHAREMGVDVAQALRDHGVSHITPRDMVLGRALTQGDFSKLMSPKYFDAKSPAHQAILAAFNKKFGANLTPQGIHLAQSAKHPAAIGALKDLEKTWKSPDSPFTSNVMANLTRGGKGGGVAQTMAVPVNPAAAAPRHGSNLVAGAMGAAASGAVEPGLGAANAFKIGLTNPTARAGIGKLPGGQRALDWADKRFVQAPVSAAVAAGKAGERMSPVNRAVQNYAFNPVTGEAANTGNMLAHAFATHPVTEAAHAARAGNLQPAASQLLKRPA
jgi:hypothetical protein